MDQELVNLKALNAQFGEIHNAMKNTLKLLQQVKRNALNSKETLRLYNEVQTGAKANTKLLQTKPGTSKLVIDTLDEDLEAMRNRVTSLKSQLEKLS